jgi:hypothetical protein
MILDEVRQELETYVRAKYPLIYLLTHEEERAQELIVELARRMKVSLYFWSCTKGFVSEKVTQEGGDLTKPEVALDYIQRSPDNGFFVLIDFHAYLDEPKIIRKLRDTIDVVTSSGKSLFILSPKKVVPTECDKEFVIVELPTPDVAEIHQIVDRSLRVLKGRVKVELLPHESAQLIDAFRGLPSNEIENVLSRMVVRDGKLNAQDLRDVVCEKGRLIAASGILQFYPPKEGFDMVGGLGQLKAWLQRKKLAFTQQAREFGLDMPKGVLLVGVPGCGKSLTAKAVSTIWQMPLLRLDIGQLFSSYIGSTEENMRKAIHTAESIAPCVLWIDEIEKGLAGVQGSDTADGGVSRRIFATLLTWMQEKRHPVFVVATANDVSTLPPEFLRKGRFDDIFYIDLPNPDERFEILSIHLTKRKRDPRRFDIATLAVQTEGFSGADLESIVSEALETAFLAGRNLEQTDLDAVAATCVPLAATMAEKIAQVRSWAQGRARRAT